VAIQRTHRVLDLVFSSSHLFLYCLAFQSFNFDGIW